MKIIARLFILCLFTLVVAALILALDRKTGEVVSLGMS